MSVIETEDAITILKEIRKEYSFNSTENFRIVRAAIDKAIKALQESEDK